MSCPTAPSESTATILEAITDSSATARARRAAEVRHRHRPDGTAPRRARIDPTTCERDYTPEQLEFMSAMQAYKLRSGRMFPTWSEALEVLQSLGYEKATPSAVSTPR